MASIEKYGIYLYIWIGLIYFAAGCTLPFCQFEQWCKNTKNAGYCEGANCTEALDSDKSCFTVLPFDPSGMSINQQHSACNYYSPYDVKEAYGINGSITCKYDIVNWCPAHEDSQIGNTCYRLSDKSKQCPAEYKMFKSTDSKERMWATILLNHGFEPVRIHNKNGSIVAMSTKIDGMNGIELGQTIQQNTDHLKTICVKSAERIPNEDRYKDLTTAGRVEYFITDNVYQPEYDANNKPSVKKYHEHCQKIFPQSVAALPNDYLNLLSKEKDHMKGKILHVAGQVVDFAQYPSCGTKPSARTTIMALSKNGTPLGINSTVYAPGYPNNKCADKPRTILTIHKNAGILNGVVDEPEFARHPLLCIRGNSPEQRREFVCHDGWFMSVRPNTIPYCYYSSIVNRHNFNASYYKLEYSYNKANYTQAKAICKDYFNASLPSLEYKSDLIALDRAALGNNGIYYLNVKRACTQCYPPKFDWVALNGTTFPVDESSTSVPMRWYRHTDHECGIRCIDVFMPYPCNALEAGFACMKEAKYL